ncbi:MAG: ribonuclease D [Kofleriaceae bacterium]
MSAAPVEPPDAPIALIDDAGEVAAIAAAVARSPLVAFDLEFLAQDRLIPTLCVVQVAWLDEHVRLDVAAGAFVAAEVHTALVDPLVVDVGPLLAALAAHPLVVAHAPRQDLGLVATRFGLAIPQIADTQVMAAFAGIGDQVGFASLANDLLGLSLGKELQWTDWGQRPLSDAQLVYAESDVLHLPALYAILRDRLGRRLAWALAESSQVAADAVAASQVTPETAWRQVNARGLDAPAMAALIELSTWRHRTAITLDRPLGQVLNEKLLVDLARQRPRDGGGVRALKGLSSIAKSRADEIVAAIAGANPAAVPPRLASKGSPSIRAQRWAEILLAIVQVVAEKSGVAARLLATRSDAEEFARAVDEGGVAAAEALPALATWRREVIGETWVAWLSGKILLAGDASAPSGVRLDEKA